MRVLVTFKRANHAWINEPVRVIARKSKRDYQEIECERRIGLTRYEPHFKYRLLNDGSILYENNCGKYKPFKVDPPTFTYDFILQVRTAIEMWLLVANRYRVVKDVKRIIAGMLMESRLDRAWLNIPST